MRYLFALALALPTIAAAQANPTRTQRGDTTIIRNTGTGRWGPIHDAKEVVRVTGPAAGDEFGEPQWVTTLPDGGVLVFDIKGINGPALQQYDANGKFVRQIGRQGGGPGEYKNFAVP